MTTIERPKVAYIAGPYRARDAWGLAENVRAAETVALRAAQLGLAPVCPHSMCHHFDGTLSDGVWLAYMLEIMRRCDVVVVVPHWHRSAGTKAEVAEATKLGIPVVDVRDLEDWCDEHGLSVGSA